MIDSKDGWFVSCGSDINHSQPRPDEPLLDDAVQLSVLSSLSTEFAPKSNVTRSWDPGAPDVARIAGFCAHDLAFCGGSLQHPTTLRCPKRPSVYPSNSNPERWPRRFETCQNINSAALTRVSDFERMRKGKLQPKENHNHIQHHTITASP